LALTALFVLACGRSASRDRPDALLVTIDTLRGDRWGCLGDVQARTPVVDRLARRSLLVPEGRASAPITLPSHATILTGLPPVSHAVRDNGIFRLAPQSGRMLAEALGERGWATAAFVSAYPLGERFGLDRGFLHYDAFLGGEDGGDEAHPFPERTAGEVLGRVRRYFDRGRAPAPDVPLFSWVHFFDPHAPYAPPEPWSDALAGDSYRGEVAYTDRILGALLFELAQRRPNIPRRIVVTSDHGEGLGEHGEGTHGLLLRASTIRVPIVIDDGRRAPALHPTPESLDRVAGTMLRILGLDRELLPDAAPPIESGAGARPALSETMYPWTNFGWRALRSWESEGWKLVHGETDRLYRPLEDPGEVHDLAATHPDVVARLRRELLEEWARRERSAFETMGESLEPADVDALRSLGYAAGSVDAIMHPERGFESGPDPEPRVGIVDEVNRAITLHEQGESAQASAILRGLVARDPSNRLAWQYLGRTSLAEGDAAAARDACRRALELGPNPVDVHLDLARAERVLGNADAARTALEAALRADPRSYLARRALAQIALDEGDTATALRVMEEAVEFRPRSSEAQASLAELYERLDRPQDALARWRRAAELDSSGPVGEKAGRAIARLAPGGA
jgi:arylsulfatase A-like enzyme/Tfp pilus assembly protein PilF